MFFNLGDIIRETQGGRWASAWRVDGFLATGRHFRHYRVRNLAADLEQQEAVLKVIKYDPQRCGDPDYVQALRERLRHERDTLAHFSPRLPEPVDYFEVYNPQDPFESFGAETLARSEPVLVRTLIHGQSLRQLMQERGAPPASAQHLLMTLARVCGFLDELHADGRGWLFWEMSPDHVIVDHDGGFTPAFVGSSNFRMMRQGQTTPLRLGPLGHAAAHPEPGYAAPEQLSGVTATPATDLYGVGALLFHIFSGIDPRDLADNIQHRHAPSTNPTAMSHDQAMDFCDDLRQSIERFCRRNLKGLGIHRARVRQLILACLSSDPDDRPESPIAVRDALITTLTRAMPLAWPER